MEDSIELYRQGRERIRHTVHVDEVAHLDANISMAEMSHALVDGTGDVPGIADDLITSGIFTDETRHTLVGADARSSWSRSVMASPNTAAFVAVLTAGDPQRLAELIEFNRAGVSLGTNARAVTPPPLSTRSNRLGHILSTIAAGS